MAAIGFPFFLAFNTRSKTTAVAIIATPTKAVSMIYSVPMIFSHTVTVISSAIPRLIFIAVPL